MAHGYTTRQGSLKLDSIVVSQVNEAVGNEEYSVQDGHLRSGRAHDLDEISNATHASISADGTHPPGELFLTLC